MAAVAPAAPPRGMRTLAVRGGVAVGLSQTVKIATQVINVVVLSRLLQPSDFGLIAALAPLIAFVNLFQGMGMQQAVVTHRDMPSEQLSRIFWLTFAVSVTCACLVAIASPAIAKFYHDPRLHWLTVAASLPLVVAGITSLPMALLSRELRFGTVAFIETISMMVGPIAAVIAAYCGAGYWSLLASTYASCLLNLAAAWMATKWLPNRPSLHLPSRSLLTFGANLSGFSIVNFFSRNLDNVLIGRVWGPINLGYYSRGYSLMLLPLQAINGPISSVLIPLMSRIEADKPQLRSVYLRTMNQVLLLAIPGMTAMTLSASDAIGLLFGSKWAPIIPIFAWLGLAGIWQPIGNSTGWLFISQGRTNAMFRWGLYSSATTVLAFIVGLPWGAVGVACAYTVTDYLLRAPVLFWYVGKLGPVRMGDFYALLAPFIVAALATLLAHEALVRHAFHLHGVFAIALTMTLSYAFAVLAVRASPGGLAKLNDSLGLAAQLARRRSR